MPLVIETKRITGLFFRLPASLGSQAIRSKVLPSGGALKTRFGFIEVLGGLLIVMVFLLVTITILAPLGRPWSSVSVFLFFAVTAAVISSTKKLNGQKENRKSVDGVR